LGSELQGKNGARKNLLAFLKRIDYTKSALGLSFFIFELAKNWPTRFSAGLCSAYDPVKLGPKALFLPANFIFPSPAAL
jgi:hypothetical protein